MKDAWKSWKHSNEVIVILCSRPRRAVCVVVVDFYSYQALIPALSTKPGWLTDTATALTYGIVYYTGVKRRSNSAMPLLVASVIW